MRWWPALLLLAVFYRLANLLVAAEQVILFPQPLRDSTTVPESSKPMTKQTWKQQATDFACKEGEGVFSPKDLVGLGRPGTGVANDVGDLVLVSYSKYDFEDKK